jgi:hypothetical protein
MKDQVKDQVQDQVKERSAAAHCPRYRHVLHCACPAAAGRNLPELK